MSTVSLSLSVIALVTAFKNKHILFNAIRLGILLVCVGGISDT